MDTIVENTEPRLGPVKRHPSAKLKTTLRPQLLSNGKFTLPQLDTPMRNSQLNSKKHSCNYRHLLNKGFHKYCSVS